MLLLFEPGLGLCAGLRVVGLDVGLWGGLEVGLVVGRGVGLVAGLATEDVAWPCGFPELGLAGWGLIDCGRWDVGGDTVGDAPAPLWEDAGGVIEPVPPAEGLCVLEGEAGRVGDGLVGDEDPPDGGMGVEAGHVGYYLSSS